VLREPPGRHDDRLADGSYLFEQRPVARRTARDLEHVETHFVYYIDRCLIERRAHRDQAARLDEIKQIAELIPSQPRREKARHMLVSAAGEMIDMNERVELAELELDRGPHP